MPTLNLVTPDGSEMAMVHNLRELYAVMAFPLPDQDELRGQHKIVMAMKNIDMALEHGKIESFPDFGPNVSRVLYNAPSYQEMNRLISDKVSLRHKLCAGLVAYMYAVQECIEPGTATINKAVYLVANIRYCMMALNSGKIVKLKSISMNDVFRPWGQYHCVAPWFAAFFVCGVNVHDFNLFGNDTFIHNAQQMLGQPKEFYAMTSISAMFAELAGLGAEAWIVPEGWPMLDPGVVLDVLRTQSADIADEVRAALADYRADKIR